MLPDRFSLGIRALFLRTAGPPQASPSPLAEKRFLLKRGATRRRGVKREFGARNIACKRSYLPEFATNTGSDLRCDDPLIVETFSYVGKYLSRPLIR